MEPRRSAVSVVLVEDHDAVRRALHALLAEGGDIDILGEARTAAEGEAESLRLAPAVVLMDVRLPDGSGIDACARIRAQLPSTRVLMLTSHDDPAARREAAAAGASGYLLKELDPAGLRQAILDVAGGAEPEPARDRD